MKALIIKHFLFISVALFFSIATYGSVESYVIKNYSLTLLAVSVAVFTLAGIWVAYIYPKAIDVFTAPKLVNRFEA